MCAWVQGHNTKVQCLNILLMYKKYVCYHLISYPLVFSYMFTTVQMQSVMTQGALSFISISIASFESHLYLYK